MAYRIQIVLDDCMSAGKCVGDYPQTFRFNDDELATLIDQGHTLSDEQLMRAARNCPSRAIQLFDEADNEVAT